MENQYENSYENSGIGACLNRYTANVVDWNRVGELLKSGKHRYSSTEIGIRLAIITGTLTGTYFLGWRLNALGFNRFNSYFSSFLFSSIVCHSLAIWGLIEKRLSIKDDIHKIVQELNEDMKKLNERDQKDFQMKIDNIFKLEANYNASSATLGMRKRLLLELKTYYNKADCQDSKNFNHDF